jgi:hypothetical protein
MRKVLLVGHLPNKLDGSEAIASNSDSLLKNLQKSLSARQQCRDLAGGDASMEGKRRKSYTSQRKRHNTLKLFLSMILGTNFS